MPRWSQCCLWVGAALLVWLGMVVTGAQAVRAETRPASAVIRVTAVVMPAREIVMDEQGSIIMVASNTSQAVLPTVYKGSLSGATTAFTSDLVLQYQQILSRYDFSRPRLLQIASLRLAKPGLVEWPYSWPS